MFSEGKERKVLYPDGRFDAIVCDTINALQNNLFQEIMTGKKGSFDEWKDFGLEVYELYNFIKKLPDTVLIQILGTEGSGKTVSSKYLDPETTAYLNFDAKPLSFKGARQAYTPEKKNYMVVNDYATAKQKITAIHAKRRGTLVIFMLGHIETYNGEGGLVRQRLKVLGKLASKLGIEGLNAFSTIYTKIDTTLPNSDPNRYLFATQNSGYNTVRTPEGFFNGDIPANMQLVLEAVLEDFGELSEKTS